MFCSKCGTALAPDAAFCSKCGTAVPVSPDVSSETTTPAEQSDPPQAPMRHPQLTAIIFLVSMGALVWVFYTTGVFSKRTIDEFVLPESLVEDTSSDVVVVTYFVTSSPGVVVDLTYANEDGGTEQRDNVTLPFTDHLTVPHGEHLYISAQNQGDSGTVTCEIQHDSIAFEKATSSGAYVIAQCNGSAP